MFPCSQKSAYISVMTSMSSQPNITGSETKEGELRQEHQRFTLWLKFPRCNFSTPTRASVLPLTSVQITAGATHCLSDKIQNLIFLKGWKKAGWKRGKEWGRRHRKWGICLKEGAERGGGGFLIWEAKWRGLCGETGEGETGKDRWGAKECENKA